MRTLRSSLFFICLFLCTTSCYSFPFSSYLSVLSISHSIASRVATLREARGDYDGAARARNFARTLEPGLTSGFYKFVLKIGWDYAKNYAWRSTASMGTIAGIFSDLSELMKNYGDLSLLQTNAERVAWASRNYGNMLKVSKSILTRLLAACRQSGPLREMVEALQKEVVEGDLLKDCLELGAGDLKGLIRILTDIALGNASDSPKYEL